MFWKYGISNSSQKMLETHTVCPFPKKFWWSKQFFVNIFLHSYYNNNHSSSLPPLNPLGISTICLCRFVYILYEKYSEWKSRDKIPPISNSVHMVNARKGWFYQALFYRATLKSIKYSRCTNYRPDKDRLAKEKDSLRESLTREKLGLDSRLHLTGLQ